MAKAKDGEIFADEGADDAGSEPRVYELGFHLDHELPLEEVKKAYQTMRERITNRGTLVAEGEPQLVPLAYTISRQETSGRRDFDAAYFCWIVYEALASSHTEVVSAANADKRIIRFIDLVTTKDAARHAIEMRELSMKMPERAKDQKEADEVLGVELDTALERAAL